VFSLSGNRKLTEEGAHFRSHIDGSKHLFTPENVVDIQRSIGADIMMQLDECPPGTADYDYAKKSLGLTTRWLMRGWKHYKETEGKYGYSQAYFPIVQGCTYPDLRRQSALTVAELGADGNAIAGLYASGEVANGGFYYQVYPASGSSLSMAMTYGLEAGRNAAAFAK
jgi:queuine tRNA-ribosyltransferase